MFEIDSLDAAIIYSMALLVSTLVCIVLAVFIWGRRPDRGTHWIAFLMIVMAVWSTAYIMEILSPTISRKFLFFNITLISKNTMPVIWLFFALKYSRQDKLITLRNLALLLIVPIIMIAATWTNDIHKLVWTRIEIDYSNPIETLARSNGPLFWVDGVYLYTLMITGVVIIIRTAVVSKQMDKRVAIIVAGLSLPILIKAITTLRPELLNNLEVTPFVFTLCWLIICWYVFRYRLLDMVPVARDAIIEQMTDGVLITDMNGHIIYHNRAANNIVNSTESSITGKSFTQLLPCDEDIAAMSGKTQVIELGSNGDHKYLATQVVFLPDDESIHGAYLVNMHDVTERTLHLKELQQYREHLENLVRARTAALSKVNVQLKSEINKHKRAKEALSTSEARYRSLFETTVAGVSIINMEGKFTFVNDALCRMIRYSNKDLLGQPFARFIHPDDSQIPGELFKNASIQPHVMIDLEFRIIREDQSIIWVHTNPSPILMHGHQVGFSAIMHNITNLKNAEAELKSSYTMLKNSLQGTINAVAKMSELRDPYTAGHQLQVARLASAIGREMNFPQDRINCIEIAAKIHDVGKIYVPAEILTKPSSLTGVEFQILKTHPQGGYDILKNIEFPWPIAQIVLQHHERINGAGYPQGLKGNDILPEAKILAVSDVVDAMVSHRPYRAALGVEKALEEIMSNKGTLYDTDVVDTCVKLLTEHKFKFEDINMNHIADQF